MIRAVLYQDQALVQRPPPAAPAATPQGFSAFCDQAAVPPFLAARVPFEAAFARAVPSTAIPHGWEESAESFPPQFKRPLAPAQQQWDAFAAAGTLVSLTPEGFFPQQPDVFTRPFPAGLQQWNAFSPAGKLVSLTPEGFLAFFDSARVPPYPASLQQVSAFSPAGKLVSLTPEGFLAFFDSARQPASAAAQPFAADWKFKVPTPALPQGRVAFFDGGRQPASAAAFAFAAFHALHAIPTRAHSYGYIIG